MADPARQTDASTARGAPASNGQGPSAATSPQAVRVAVSRGEAILLLVLVLLGLGVWLATDRLVTSYTKDYEPREEQVQIERNLPRLQAGLAMTQEEMKSTQEQLIKSRLELAEDEAALAALEAVPHVPAEKANAAVETAAPAGQKAGAAGKPNAPKQAASEPKPAASPEEDPHAEAYRKREAAARLVNSLIARLDELQGAADRLGAETEKARVGVGGVFYRSQWNFRMLKMLGTMLLAAFVLVALVWGIGSLRRAEKLRGKVPGVSADGSLMWWTVAGLLLVLFGYEAFEAAGAALAGVAVLLVFLARVPWPEVRAAAAKAEEEKVKAKAGAGAGAAGGV